MIVVSCCVSIIDIEAIEFLFAVVPDSEVIIKISFEFCLLVEIL